MKDRATGESLHLPRDAANEALAILARADMQIDDASKPPAPTLECSVRRMRWQFSGSFRDQNAFNN